MIALNAITTEYRSFVVTEMAMPASMKIFVDVGIKMKGVTTLRPLAILSGASTCTIKMLVDIVEPLIICDRNINYYDCLHRRQTSYNNKQPSLTDSNIYIQGQSWD